MYTWVKIEKGEEKFILPNDVKAHKFTKKRGLYNPREVDEFLEKVAYCYNKTFRENDELLQKLDILADILERYRKDEENNQSSLCTAETKANQTIENANREAQKIIEQAKLEAQRIIKEANNSIKKTGGSLKLIYKPNERECSRLLQQNKND